MYDPKVMKNHEKIIPAPEGKTASSISIHTYLMPQLWCFLPSGHWLVLCIEYTPQSPFWVSAPFPGPSLWLTDLPSSCSFGCQPLHSCSRNPTTLWPGVGVGVFIFILFKVLNLISLSLRCFLRLFLLCSSRAMTLKSDKPGWRSQFFFFKVSALSCIIYVIWILWVYPYKLGVIIAT